MWGGGDTKIRFGRITYFYCLIYIRYTNYSYLIKHQQEPSVSYFMYFLFFDLDLVSLVEFLKLNMFIQKYLLKEWNVIPCNKVGLFTTGYDDIVS